MVSLSEQQLDAVYQIRKWYAENQSRVFVLHGYAGTGKTTIAKELPRMLGIPDERACFMAYTGKAAVVLREKGCNNATTIHRSIYQPAGNQDEELRGLLDKLLAAKDEEEKRLVRIAIAARRKQASSMGWRINPSEQIKQAKLVVIDESSMLDEKLLSDILKSTNAKVLLLGDPAQLPPVRAKQLDLPANILLKEIHRQAAENPLLHIATQVRAGKPLKHCEISNEHGSIKVAGLLPQEVWLQADQIIVGRNETRIKINRRMRELLHNRTADAPPKTDDKIVILRNDHSLGIFNGMVGKLTSETVPAFDDEDSFFADFTTQENECFAQLEFSNHGFNEIAMGDIVSRDYVLADYGYALTCHKAQGSEWNNIAIIVERGQFVMSAWLYTAITRARKTCNILLKE